MDSKRSMVISRLKRLWFVLACLPAIPAAAAEAPAYATEVGYTQNTFSTDFTSANVDASNSQQSGYAWYLWNLYGRHANGAAVGLNSDGSVTLAGDTTGPNGELMTATPAKNAAGFVGTAFGGGAYIEATFKFDPADVQRANSKTWPSFWSMAFESSMRPGANQWQGQPTGYVHQIEVDFFEYLLLPYGGPPNAYAASMHEWYGVYKNTCPAGLCQVAMDFNDSKRIAPQGTDFTQYHTYGSLWVPATAGTTGYMQFFFDGAPIGAVKKWTQFTGQPPSANLKQQPWAFGVLDQQHLVLILGTGPQEPMTVRSVNVWQASAAQNLHN